MSSNYKVRCHSKWIVWYTDPLDLQCAVFHCCAGIGIWVTKIIAVQCSWVCCDVLQSWHLVYPQVKKPVYRLSVVSLDWTLSEGKLYWFIVSMKHVTMNGWQSSRLWTSRVMVTSVGGHLWLVGGMEFSTQDFSSGDVMDLTDTRGYTSQILIVADLWQKREFWTHNRRICPTCSYTISSWWCTGSVPTWQ